MNGTSRSFSSGTRASASARPRLSAALVAAAIALVVPLSCAAAEPSAPLQIEPHARVVIVGNTLAERMQYFGHWETLLHDRFPRHELVVRNLGWSADEVDLRPRSQNFAAHGHTLADHRPDVLVAMFGFNESFAGAAGLPRFRADLDRWLGEVTTTPFNGTRPPTVVLCSPIAHENLKSRFLPDGSRTNPDLERYTAAMREVAAKHGVRFVDLFTPSRRGMAEAARPWTFNGVHLDEWGDRQVAELLDRALFAAPAAAGPPRIGAVPATWRDSLEPLRAAVNDKNRTFFHDLRAVNGCYIYGGRRNPFGSVNFPPEFAKLRAMTALRDRRIWTIAQGRPVPAAVDDREAGTLPVIPTNVTTPIPPTTPEESRALMQVADGFAVSLFASEVEFPELAKPVQIAFDARGRLWVCTMPSYPQLLPGEPPDDKVLILEDTDGDGRADKRTVFAAGLSLPTGLELGDGGAYVAQQPNLMFLRDSDGDDRADRRDLILHGFDSADSHHAISAFTWDQGGGLYMQEGTFLYSQVETPYGPVRLADGGVYRYEPRTGRLGVFVSYRFANPWGHVFDRWGQSYVADASPGFNYFGATISGDVDYPRKHGTAPQLFSKQWRPTAACELVSSGNFPADMQGDYLLCNVIGFQGVLRYRLRDDGSAVAGQAADPLLSSRDPNFRPVDLEFGPDGSLYICDWFNPLVGHMQHSIRDPSRDRSHGRIWRVHATRRPLVTPARIVGRPTPELIDLLCAAPDERTCSRVRMELRSRDAAAVRAAADARLAALGPDAADGEHQRLEMLWLRQQHDDVDERLLDRVLASPEPRARAAAVRVLGLWRDRLADPLGRLVKAVRDKHPRVRLETVRAASFARGADVARALEIAADAVTQPLDEHLRYVVRETWATLDDRIRGTMTAATTTVPAPVPGGHPDPAAPALSVKPLVDRLRAGQVPRQQVPFAVELICQHGHAADLAFVFETFLAAGDQPADLKGTIVESLVDAATTRKLRPAGEGPALERLLDSAAAGADQRLERGLRRLGAIWQVASVTANLRRVLLDPRADDESIRGAAGDLAALDDPAARDLLKELTGREAPSMRVRLQAVAAYAKVAPESAAGAAAGTLSEAGPGDRIGDVLDAFLQLKKGPALLGAKLAQRPLNEDTAKLALRHLDGAGRSDAELTGVLAAAAGVAAAAGPPSADEIRRIATDAAGLGDAVRGERVFRRAELRCTTCHAINRAGGVIGPELTTIGSISPVEYLAAAVLDPDSAIKEQYITRVIVTAQGEAFTGIVVDRNAERVNLRDATGRLITIPVEEIEEEAEGRSLMPQGLTRLLTRDELLDLVKYLAELGRPGRYALPAAPTIQRWLVAAADGATAAQSPPDKPPAAAAATILAYHDGSLPVAEAAAAARGPGDNGAASPRPALPAAVVLRGEIAVTQAGPLVLALAGPADARWFLDGRPLEVVGPRAEVPVTLAAGRHEVQVRVQVPAAQDAPGAGSEPAIRVELRKPAGSAVQFEPVGM
jgi:putative heme-binding domain-containing protein